MNWLKRKGELMKRLSAKYVHAPKAAAAQAAAQPEKQPLAPPHNRKPFVTINLGNPLLGLKKHLFGRRNLSAVFLGATLCAFPQTSLPEPAFVTPVPQVDLDHPSNAIVPVKLADAKTDRLERRVPLFVQPLITQDMFDKRVPIAADFRTAPVFSLQQSFDQAIYNWPTSKPKPLVIFDLGHNARYTENGCDIDPGAHYKGTNEVEIVDALAKHVLAALGPAKDYELVLTRQPGQELPGGCMDHRTSIISRLKVAQDAVKAGRETLFISLHVDAAGWGNADHVAVYASSTHLGSQNLMGLMAQTMRDTSPTLKVDTRIDSRDLLIFNQDHQTATPVLIEFSDIRFGKRLKDPVFLARKGQDIAAGMRFAINNAVGAAAFDQAMNGLKAFGSVRPSPM